MLFDQRLPLTYGRCNISPISNLRRTHYCSLKFALSVSVATYCLAPEFVPRSGTSQPLVGLRQVLVHQEVDDRLATASQT